LFVTHDAREAVRLATRIVLLAEGTVAFAGTVAGFRGCGHPEAAAFQRELE
jgi:ABC-type proline/glycine betaine transport system ATPase subunit